MSSPCPFLIFRSREMMTGMRIRPAHVDDASSIWRIFGPTIRAGETYSLDRDMTEADALAYWLGDDRETFVAEDDGDIVGTYYIRANQVGAGNTSAIAAT